MFSFTHIWAQNGVKDSLYKELPKPVLDEVYQLKFKEVLVPVMGIGTAALFVCDGWFTEQRENVQDLLSAKGRNKIKLGLLAHFTQIYHLYNLLIYNILRRNLQLFITEFCIFSPCIIFISNKNSDKSIEILHISPKYITSVDNLMIHIFSSTFNFLYSFTPSDRLESKS